MSNVRLYELIFWTEVWLEDTTINLWDNYSKKFSNQCFNQKNINLFIVTNKGNLSANKIN